jgi:aryl-alcohol dehydrogenase-like predicted oxidoreductase
LVARYSQRQRLRRVDWLLSIIISRSAEVLVMEFCARLRVEFAVAGAFLDGLLQNPIFQGDDDGRKQD